MTIPESIIFWDWNGTLLDDAGTCLSTMNTMLNRRGMPAITLETYKEVFGFPVIDYYRKIGFDFIRESFEQLSVEFIEVYNKALGSVPLVKDAEEVLVHFSNMNKKNIIVSAMKQDFLLQSVKEKKIEKYFTHILGIDSIYAASKSSMVLNFVSSHNINNREILLIGDTTHDYEVALQIGCRCILVADGHQAEERLKATGAKVICKLSDLLRD